MIDIASILLFTCFIPLTLSTPSAEATFGHEHVHIRVHVPKVKIENHHTEKAIVKEIPIIRHRYKQNIFGAAAHVYHDHDNDNDNDNVHGINYNSYNYNYNYNNNLDVDDGDENEDDGHAVFATATRGFHHRNLYATDDDLVAAQQQLPPATYSSYSRTRLLQDRRLGHNKPAPLPPLSYLRPTFAATSIGRGGDDDDDDNNNNNENEDDNNYRYAKTWSIMAGHPTATIVAAPAKREKNVSALYELRAKNYAPSMAHSDTAFGGSFDRVVSSSSGGDGGSGLDQNVVDYYRDHTAPEAADDNMSSVVEDSADDDDDDEEENDDSSEFASLQFNWNKPKRKIEKLLQFRARDIQRLQLPR